MANGRAPWYLDSMSRCALVLVLALFCARESAAQVVRGVVVDQARMPVPGVLLQLLDGTSVASSRALTNERGEYRLVAPRPGTYRVRTMRIGFRPNTSDTVTLAAGQEITKMLTLSGVAFSLDTVKVVSQNECRVPSDSAAATFAVWEQARAALTAATLTTRQRGVSARIVQFDRLFDPELRRMKLESAWGLAGYNSRAWRALSADSLHAGGYVVADRDGSVTYYAPDIEVMLSDVFMEDHCFRLVDNTNLRRLGIMFEPTRARADVPEIRGTIWLDRKSAELRLLEFRYANLPRSLDVGDAGGAISFAQLTNRAWVITRWDIRMPIIKQRIGTLQARIAAGYSSGDEHYVSEMQVTGGQLAVVVRGRDTLWAHPPLSVSGTVIDAASGRLVAGAAVSLRGTPIKGVSDTTGAFRLSPVLPGDYTLVVTSPTHPAEKPFEERVIVVDAPVERRVRIPSHGGRPERDR